jgi:hypothetical protein
VYRSRYPFEKVTYMPCVVTNAKDSGTSLHIGLAEHDREMNMKMLIWFGMSVHTLARTEIV